MAVFHPRTVNCKCGETLTVQLADSLNIKRSPEAREKILRGELHRAFCPCCKREMTVEKPFYYSDLTRNTFFKVLPSGERHLWKKASKDLETAANYFPEQISDPDSRTLRVIFGMDELREKLVAQDAEIDDRIVELLKVFLVYEHPVLLRRARLRLVLDSVTEDSYEFSAGYEHHTQRFRLAIPIKIVKEIASKPEELQNWVKNAHPNSSIFELNDHWVNMWRWSPQPSALEMLEAYAQQLSDGQPFDTDSNDFKQMLDYLPRGNHLPSWAKQALRLIFDFAKKNDLQELQDTLFEIRFKIELEDDWSANEDREDIDTLWKLLKDLPDSNVEGNTRIHEILLGVGEKGGWYNPDSFDISIGSKELPNQERFEDVMRHEVGHAVHEMRLQLVNAWLESRFGWRILGTSDGDIDQWVGFMGGWGDLTATEQKEVRECLREALGNRGGWKPGPTPEPPEGHAWYRADFGPRRAFEQTGPSWFKNYDSWYRQNGRAFFLNFYYQTLVAVDAATLELVGEMPSNYASMSHFEFFAELYALYYDVDDPMRDRIPADVMKWLDENIGGPEQHAPMPGPPTPKEPWETITRPSGPPQ